MHDDSGSVFLTCVSLLLQGKSAAQNAGSKLPNTNQAAEKVCTCAMRCACVPRATTDSAWTLAQVKSLGNDIGSKIPNVNQLGSKAKSAVWWLQSHPTNQSTPQECMALTPLGVVGMLQTKDIGGKNF